ncbi:uncharacterized protein IWZ02DRAFT_86934 [Phyllosticta citriasiana]|uniref:uncharacterized protein n=1 Tax=Phyllosticta citriasiana TaxID=595635 RepID=UPI0030FD661D
MKCSSYSRSPSSRSLATNMAWCLNQGVERGTWDPKNCENCKTFLSKKTVAWCPLDPTQMWCIPDTPAANLPRSSLRRNSRIQTIVATMTSATKSSQQMSARERTSGKISKAKTLAFSAQDAIREPLPLIEDETKPASTCVIGVTEMTYHQGNLARTRQYQSASTAISAMHEFKQQQFAFPNSLVPFFSTSGFSAADWHRRCTIYGRSNDLLGGTLLFGFDPRGLCMVQEKSSKEKTENEKNVAAEGENEIVVCQETREAGNLKWQWNETASLCRPSSKSNAANHKHVVP